MRHCKKKLKIAVFLNGDIGMGGGFSYQLRVVSLLKTLDSDRYSFLFFTNDSACARDFTAYGINVSLIKENILRRFLRHLIRSLFFYELFKLIKCHINFFEKQLLKQRIDLVFFLSPHSLAMDLSFHNYIITVWDLCHRDHVEFPEISFNREFEKRELLYVHCLKKALAVLVESAVGMQNVVRRYGIDEKRVAILPLPSFDKKYLGEILSNESVDIVKKYSLYGDYIFYPAQFWSHKNHVYILSAIKTLKENHGIFLKAVFCGAEKGNLEYVLNVARDFGVLDLTNYLGFVPADEIPLLYKHARALVMPTFFGPTNIPPLEAFAVGCPVCYSDIEGARSQLGEAPYYIDLYNSDSLVEAILQIFNDPKVLDNKIRQGKRIIEIQHDSDYLTILASIFDRYSITRFSWGDL